MQTIQNRHVKRIIETYVDEGDWLRFLQNCREKHRDPFEYLALGIREEIKAANENPSLLR